MTFDLMFRKLVSAGGGASGGELLVEVPLVCCCLTGWFLFSPPLVPCPAGHPEGQPWTAPTLPWLPGVHLVGDPEDLQVSCPHPEHRGQHQR